MSSENVASTPETKEYLTESERHALDLVKMKRALVQAQGETAELMYNNLVLQLTLKYSLNEKDVISEQGEIIRGAK